VTAGSVVLDASATASWLLPDAAGAASQRAYAQLRRGAIEAHAPELWLWECANIIANSAKRRRVSPADALLTWSVLDAIRSHVELVAPVPAQVRAALALAIELGLSAYDGAYLWLAVSLGLPLLTHDRQLAAAARTQSVRVLTLADIR
jgi:predicted nucleic acid-binding protein